MAIIPPGSTIGMLGGGQLGRMFVIAARTMGFEVVVLDPDAHSPGGAMATRHIQAEFTNRQALDEIAGECAVVSAEFENIPADALEYLEQRVPLNPSSRALATAQNRIVEKRFIRSLGLATPGFIVLESAQDLAQLDEFEFPAILKTATLGYDGKGQALCHNPQDVERAFERLGTACVLERLIDLELEVSAVLGRNASGQCFFFPIAQNSHQHGILDVCQVPAAIDPAMQQQVQSAARKIADGLDYCGVMAVEFFISRQGDLLVNEMAPRPHNSGHFTLDACRTSQFDLQVQMICDLPAGDLTLHSPVAMLNILGDVWPEDGGQPDWSALLGVEGARLHLYGKKHPRSGRKMGHVCFTGASVEQAVLRLARGRAVLGTK
jgi:5-(carboxyamino)imidazole ribonucleotide synthase